MEKFAPLERYRQGDVHRDALDEANDEPVRLSGASRSVATAGGSRRGSHSDTSGWVDDHDDPSSSSPPGLVMGSTTRFNPTTTTRKAEEADTILCSSSYRKAEEEVGNGLRRVEIYEPEVELPALAGVILLSGISDVIKGFRSESERGLEHLSYLRRATGPSHFNCLIHSPAHLLYAAKNIVDTRLLPPKFLLVHGGKDQVVPVEQSTLLKTLLVGIGVEQVRLRAYRNLGSRRIHRLSLLRDGQVQYEVYAADFGGHFVVCRSVATISKAEANTFGSFSDKLSYHSFSMMIP